MNRDHMLFHLREAHEQLVQTIKEVHENRAYDIGEYYVDMQHLYHHLNTAWNGRDAASEQVQNVTDELFQRWSRYPDPEDLPPLGG